MQGNHWEIQIVKKKNGAIRLKFNGYSRFLSKYLIALLIVLMVGVSVVPDLFHY
ncbi:MAG: hypothetical protein KZQ76_02625 [Candidatus Thiodiazotropha sp. (ex Epidulcina cf. delphinae)]|nr:hypothetical protein [Candidatus Thiodiazotropha sp. (ex Epidulcina cf. delphinae)]